MLNICDYRICLYLRFLSCFQKLKMKTVQKRVFGHVEHLRLLRMPIFAFLKQFSIIDAFFSMLNIYDCCICLYLRFLSCFHEWILKTVPKRVFRHVEHLRLPHMPLFAFLKLFSKIDFENSAKTRFSAC